jgi:hypothetical protein
MPRRFRFPLQIQTVTPCARLSRVFGATFGLAQYLQKRMKRKDPKHESLGEGGRLIEIGEAKD